MIREEFEDLKEHCPGREMDWDWWTSHLQRNYFGGKSERLHWDRAAKHLIQDMNLEPGMSVLDLGCGSGDIEFRLALNGINATGLDQSETLIRECQKEAVDRGVMARFIADDMFNYTPTLPFDGLISINTSFGYGSDEQNRNLIPTIYSWLKPGGKFYLDTVVADEAEPFGLWSDYLLDGVLIVDNTYDESEQLMISRPYWLSPDEQLLYSVPTPERVRLYTSDQLREMLESAGFGISTLRRGPGRVTRNTGPNSMITWIGSRS